MRFPFVPVGGSRYLPVYDLICLSYIGIIASSQKVPEAFAFYWFFSLYFIPDAIRATDALKVTNKVCFCRPFAEGLEDIKQTV